MLFGKLERYVAKAVFSATLLVIIVLVAVMSISLFLQEIERVNRHYLESDVLYVVLLSIPSMVYQILPVAVLIGVLLGVGGLSEKSEITAIRASGFKKSWFVIVLIKFSFILALFFTILSQFGLPELASVVNDRKVQGKGGSAYSIEGSGGWFKESNNFVNVSSIRSNGTLNEVKIFQFDDDGRLLGSTFAKRGFFNQDSKAWELENVEKTLSKSGKMQREMLSTYRWNSDLEPSLLWLTLAIPTDLSLSHLRALISYQKKQGISTVSKQLVFWQKLFLPLSVISLALVGLAFVLKADRSVSVGQRIVVGVLIGFTFKYIQEILGPLSQIFGLTPLFSALFPIVLGLCIATWLLARVR